MAFELLAKIAPTAKPNSTEVISTIIIGIVVVFIVLILLVFAVKLFGLFFTKSTKKTKPVEVVKEKTVVAPTIVEPVNETDDDEVIAVISAVIAQMSANDGKQYKIKSVKEKNEMFNNRRTAWANEGLRQNMSPF